jgi:hypothetical protein
MSMVEIHHITAHDPTTTHLKAVLGGCEVAHLELRWRDRTNGRQAADGGGIEIRGLRVDPRVHGRGVVGRLFERLLVLARGRGVHRVDIVVHHAAVGACRDLGFRIVGDGLWVGSRRFVPMSLDLRGWSGSRDSSRTGHAIARLARSRVLDSPPMEADRQRTVA